MYARQPGIQALIAGSPELAQQYAQSFQNVLGQQVPGQQQAVIHPEHAAAVSTTADNPAQPVVSTPQSGVQQGQNTISPSLLQSLQSAVGSKLMKDTNTSQVLNQRTYALSVHNMLNKLAPDMPEITQFAGLAGQAKKSADAYAASMGLSRDPAYIKFNNFANIQAPLITNEIRRAFGGQATDSEQRLMSRLVNPVYWKTSPQLAMSQFQQLIDSLKQNETALIENPQQVQKSLEQQLSDMRRPARMQGTTQQNRDPLGIR
jgi:hypothetical protein